MTRLMKTRAFLFVTGCIAVADAARGSPVDPADPLALQREHFAAISDGSRTVRLFADEAGRITFLSGAYELSTEQPQEVLSATTDSVAHSITSFIKEHRTPLGLGDVSPIELRESHRYLAGEMINVVMAPSFNGIPVLEAEIIALLTKEGRLDTLQGKLHSRPTSPPVSEPTTVLAAAADKGLFVAPESEWLETSPYTLQSNDGDLLAFGFRDSTASMSWMIQQGQWTYFIDDATLDVAMRDRTDYERDTCNVTYQDFLHSGSFTTSFSTYSGHPVEDPTCEADWDIFGTCYWKLKYNECCGTDHSINQIMDEISSEVQDIQSCNSTATPTFSSTGGAGERQQTAFVAIQGMRHFITDNVFSQIAPLHNDTMNTEVASSDCTCYRDWQSNTIFIGIARSTALDAYMHEYGHYVVHEYGDVSDQCDDGVSGNQGDALDETLASVFGLLVAMDDPDINPTYGALAGFANSQAPAAHTNSSSKIAHSTTCPPDHHLMGRAFEQAMWELMRNVTVTASTALVSTQRSSKTISG